MIRQKTFEDDKVLGKWLVLIDGTELEEGFKKKNDYDLKLTFHRDEENEFVKYHRSVVEAKLYFGNKNT